MVFNKPASRFILGSQFNFDFAWLMSGLRITGSSRGNSLKVIFELEFVNFTV